jgi:hypothetical protein
MGLKEVLSKMKIVEMDSDEAPVPPPKAATLPSGVTPGMTAGAPMPAHLRLPGSPGLPKAPGSPAALQDISDVLGTMPPPREIDEKALPPEAGGGGGEIPDFNAVFKAAGITDPAHGYSAYKVLEILSSPEFANLDSKAKAAALSGFLKMSPTGPVPISDVVQDAVRRDQALDKFEDFLRTKLKARTEQMEKENRDLQAEIDALAQRNREKMEANRKTLAAEEERFARWQITKRIEERRLFDAVAPFVETNPISTGTSGTSGEARPAPAPSRPPGTEGAA